MGTRALRACDRASAPLDPLVQRECNGGRVGHVDKILAGTKASELPVEQANRYDVTVNLKTAKALGLTIPPSLLVRANAIVQ